jgi:vancomycin resistance protein YoaR
MLYSPKRNGEYFVMHKAVFLTSEQIDKLMDEAELDKKPVRAIQGGKVFDIGGKIYTKVGQLYRDESAATGNAIQLKGRKHQKIQETTLPKKKSLEVKTQKPTDNHCNTQKESEPKVPEAGAKKVSQPAFKPKSSDGLDDETKAQIAKLREQRKTAKGHKESDINLAIALLKAKEGEYKTRHEYFRLRNLCIQCGGTPKYKPPLTVFVFSEQPGQERRIELKGITEIGRWFVKSDITTEVEIPATQDGAAQDTNDDTL